MGGRARCERGLSRLSPGATGKDIWLRGLVLSSQLRSFSSFENPFPFGGTAAQDALIEENRSWFCCTINQAPTRIFENCSRSVKDNKAPQIAKPANTAKQAYALSSSTTCTKARSFFRSTPSGYRPLAERTQAGQRTQERDNCEESRCFHSGNGA